MPEYLVPGVYVEEVSFRSKSIEGVATSTTGFVGFAPFGPVCVPGIGPTTCESRLMTSFTEFERVYGGLSKIKFNGATEERHGFLAHAVRAFFDNGGQRVYISRVFAAAGNPDTTSLDDWGIARNVLGNVGGESVSWQARWPGRLGNGITVSVQIDRSRNVAYEENGAALTRTAHGDVVEIYADEASIPADNAPLDTTAARVVQVDEDDEKTYVGGAAPAIGEVVVTLKLRVRITGSGRDDEYADLVAWPTRTRYVGRIFDRDHPEDEDAMVWLPWPATNGDRLNAALALMESNAAHAASLMSMLHGSVRLADGNDGDMPGPDDLAGDAADPDDPAKKATGLEALAEIDDIAIVAAPDGGAYDDDDTVRQAADRLLSHAERDRYRIAVVDGPDNQSLNQIRAFRGQFDSKYGALYYPWIEIMDPEDRPAQGAPPKRIMLPPSGFVTGIYARNDITRGVHKAPANEVVRGLTRFEANVNAGRQAVLNPAGINALRFFKGRGHRVWGARTMSSDPEWMYVNVRRLFIFMEHSIDDGTQWAVFEPNNRFLWANIRRTVEDFLYVLWRDGALMGSKPEEAYFVRCDRTTMTQNDLDNGRLICLIGVAPVKPAEFVIFRIGQWTADAAIT